MIKVRLIIGGITGEFMWKDEVMHQPRVGEFVFFSFGRFRVGEVMHCVHPEHLPALEPTEYSKRVHIVAVLNTPADVRKLEKNGWVPVPAGFPFPKQELLRVLAALA